MEKYGTIPKRFTRDWWGYFWDYYKIHTISAGIAAVLIGTTAYQCATQTKYDLNISFIGPYQITEEMQNSLSEMISPEIDEITDNKQLDIGYITYMLNPDNADKSSAEYEYAMQMKLMAELQAGETDIYILSGSNASYLSSYSDCFMNVSEFSGEEYSDNMLLKDGEGRAFAVSLKDNPVLTAAGIDCSDMYLAVRYLFESNEKKESYILMHENSLKAVAFLTKE